MTLQELLLMTSGDVESNPGPVRPGLLKSLLNILKPVHTKYEDLGEKLKVPAKDIKALTMMYKGDSVRIFIEIINRWLNNYEEDYVEVCVNEGEILKRACCIHPFSKREYVNILSDALTEIGELHVAEALKYSYESQTQLYQSLLQDLDCLKEKYASIGVELEVALSEIGMLEVKHPDDHTQIFAGVLLYWIDSCNGKHCIRELCDALKAVDEFSVAEMILDKYQSRKEYGAINSGKIMETTPSSQDRLNAKSEEEHHNSSSLPLISSNGRDMFDGVDAGLTTQYCLNQCTSQSLHVTRTGNAELTLYLPHSLCTPETFKKLDGLAETMKDTGDNLHPIKVSSGDKTVPCNVQWKDIEWNIFHFDASSGPYVKGLIKIYLTLNKKHYDDFMQLYENGVTKYLQDLLQIEDVHVEEDTTQKS